MILLFDWETRLVRDKIGAEVIVHGWGKGEGKEAV